jgi:hypothetical protein
MDEDPYLINGNRPKLAVAMNVQAVALDNNSRLNPYCRVN